MLPFNKAIVRLPMIRKYKVARDINERLQQGKPIENFFADTIDIAQSLSTFIALYDATGQPIRSTGYLGGKMPELPAGVFDFAKTHAEHKVTWQPRKGLRIAMVIISSNSSNVSFVAAGRSLQEVEVREHTLVTMVIFGWTMSVGLVVLLVALQFYRCKHNKS